MDVGSSTMALLCGAFFFAGIIDAVSGGGGLLTIPAFLLTGFPVHMIAGTNQCSCLLGALTSLYRYVKSGKVYWFTAVISAVTAVFGSMAGARLNLLVPEKYLQMIMIVVLPVVAVMLFANKEFGQENKSDLLSKRQQAVRAFFIGLVLGGYTGFYGAGGGTLILLSFAVFTKLDLVMASGNTKVCSTVATVTASITYALSGAVVWPVIFCAAVFHMAGSYIGTVLALKKGARVIRPMFLMVLLILFVRVVWTAVSG